jgi:chitinase
LQDGGSGDLDGVANGIIVGMGAHGSIRSISSNLDGSGSGGGGGGGGGCFINSLRLF